MGANPDCRLVWAAEVVNLSDDDDDSGLPEESLIRDEAEGFMDVRGWLEDTAPSLPNEGERSTNDDNGTNSDGP